MTGALALVAALTISSQLQTHPTGLPSVGPSRANSLRTAPIMDKLYEQAGKPALDFDFARYKDLHDNASGATSLINFSRSAAQSPGTYVGADGLIHDAAVNLALYSEQFDNAAWLKSGATVEANQIAAPDGKQTADKLIATQPFGVSANRVYDVINGGRTLSVYAKAAEADSILIRTADGNNITDYVIFDLTDGSASFSGTGHESFASENVGNGWFRVSVTSNEDFALIYLAVAGDNCANGNGIYIWGAQLEETDAATMAPTAYIKTTSQALAAPRFDHVPTTGNVTTNLLTYSEMFDRSDWQYNTTALTVTANAATAPDGTQTAELLTTAATPGASRLRKNLTYQAGTHTYSFYGKTNSGTQWVYFTMYDGTTSFPAWAELTTEWQRVDLTATMASGFGLVSVGAVTGNGSTTYEGGAEIVLWGAQLEASPSAGPYVRTLSETRSISDANAESLGLLVEEARANLFPYSDQIETLFPSRIGIIIEATDAATSPNGKNTAELFRESATTGIHEIYRPQSGAGTYAWSIFVKQGAGNRVLNLCSSNGASNYFAVRFDLQTETIAAPVVNGAQYSGVSGQLKHYGNGWYRATVLFTSSDIWYPQIAFSTSNTSTIGTYGLESYAGDNTSSFYLFGAQLEEASFPTSWIPTGGTSQYRYADVAAVQDEDFSTTNLLAYSESFDVAWNPTGLEPIVANDAVSPDGQTTADKIIPTAAGGAHDVNQYPSVVSGTKYALTVYAKPAGFNYISLFNQHSGTGFGTVVFDVQNGTVTAAANGASTSQASISSVGNGWFRAVYMFTATATSSSSYTGINVRPDGGSGAFVGNGTDGAYLWGASLTATEYPVEYVTTRNLLTDSQDFERWTTAQEFSDNGVNAPDGTPTASTISRISGGPAGTITNGNFTIGAIGEKVVLSVYAKHQDATVKTLHIVPDNTGAGGYPLTGGYALSTFDLENGTVVSSGAGLTSSIVDVGNGWYRCSVAATAVSTGTYTPGFEAPFGASVAIWGAQLEPGTTATDYVRTVDAVGKSYGWYEPTEGTVLSSHNIDTTSGNRIPVAFSDGTTSNQIYLGAGNGFSGLTITLAGAPQVGLFKAATAPADTDILHVAGFAYNDSAYRTNIGSMALESTSSGSIPNVNKMFIGGYNVSGVFSGHIKRLTYWPRRQSDSTLQVITQ